MRSFLFLVFLLLATNALASSISITGLDTNSTTVIERIPSAVVVHVTASNLPNSPFNFNLIGYDGTTQFYQGTNQIDDNSSKDILLPFTAIGSGDHNIFVAITDFPNNESTDTNKSLVVRVQKLQDFRVSGIVVSPVLAKETQSSFEVFIENIGGPSLQPVPVRTYIDGVRLSDFNIVSLDANAIYHQTIDFVTPSNGGAHTISVRVDENNFLPELDEYNNNRTASYTIVGGVDLFVQVADINITGTGYVDRPISGTVTIHNASNTPTQSVLIRVYHGTEQIDSLILSTIIELPAGGTQTLPFTFIPRISGQDVIITKIDPLNSIIEDNEQNNYAEKTFEVQTRPDLTSSNFTSYTVWMNIHESCFALFSNNDKFTTKRIVDVGSNDFRLDFDLRDTFGTNLISQASAGPNEEFQYNGRTIRVLSVSGNIASVVFVFSSPISVVYTTCEMDLEKLSKDLQDKTTALNTCTSDLASKNTQLNALNESRATNIQTVSTCQSDLQACNTTKASLEQNIYFLDSNYNARLLLQSAQDANSCNLKLSAKDTVIKELEFSRTFGYILVFLGSIVASFYAVLVRRGRM